MSGSEPYAASLVGSNLFFYNILLQQPSLFNEAASTPTSRYRYCGGCKTTALPSIIAKKVNKNSENIKRSTVI